MFQEQSSAIMAAQTVSARLFAECTDKPEAETLTLPLLFPPPSNALPLLLYKALASFKARVFQILDNSWHSTLDCCPLWSSPPASAHPKDVRSSNLHNSVPGWLLPEYLHTSPGSSTGNSFIDSLPHECGSVDPALILSSHGLSERSDSQFSSPDLPFLSSDGEAWDSEAPLDFGLPLFPPLPLSDGTNTQAAHSSSRNRQQKESVETYPAVSITFSEPSASDSHFAFFSQDLNFAPVAPVYQSTREIANDTIDTIPDLDAFLEDMSNGPANVAVSPILTPLPPTTSSSPEPILNPKTNSPKTTLPAPARVTKEFHFVANSDKAGAARVRNTMASRKHRQSKVNRIAELEKLLAEAEEERDMWKKRALGKEQNN